MSLDERNFKHESGHYYYMEHVTNLSSGVQKVTSLFIVGDVDRGKMDMTSS